MAKKKKNSASLDEILEKLNQAERDFKTIYSQVDFDSFRVKESSEQDHGPNDGQNQ